MSREVWTYAMFAAPSIPNFNAFAALGISVGEEACKLRPTKPNREVILRAVLQQNSFIESHIYIYISQVRSYLNGFG